jgi:hypothetical protein
MDTTRRAFSVFFFCFIIYFCADISANEVGGTGTLIVTYQTNKDGANLDRIRFLIKGENFKQWLYPKGRSYFEDPIAKIRKVVIENLPEGHYKVEFLVPNTTGFFGEVPIRHVKIVAGAVVKIDQLIKPLTASSEKALGTLIVSYDAGKDTSLLEKIKFSLIDEKENSRSYPHEGEYYNALEGEARVVIISDLSAGHYLVRFFIEGRDGITSFENQEVEIEEKKTTTIHQSIEN